MRVECLNANICEFLQLAFLNISETSNAWCHWVKNSRDLFTWMNNVNTFT